MNFYDILLAKKLSGGGGGDITTEALNVTANGEYTAPTGKAYTPVNVNVPLPANAYLKKTATTSMSDAEQLPVASAKVSVTDKDKAELFLTSDGVVSEDNTPYTYRPSPSGKSCVDLSVVGGTVAWNQLYNMSATSNETVNDVTFTKNNGYINVNGTASANIYKRLQVDIPTVNGHKMLASLVDSAISGLQCYDDNPTRQFTGVTTQNVFIANGNDIRFYVYIENNTQISDKKIYPQLIDLTQAFGSTIADYIYSLEQATAGSGIAWLKSYGFFTKDYYAYQSGKLESVNVASRKVYDSNNTLVTTYPLDSNLTLRGIPKLDANNNLYYDGDTYESDGTVTRKYGIVDLGTLTWSYDSTYKYFYTAQLVASLGSKMPSFNLFCGLYKCVTMEEANQFSDVTKDLIMAVVFHGHNNALNIRNLAYTDAATFKTAMNGVYLVYELATPTSETADAYENPQLVGSTEEFVDAQTSASTPTRDVDIPVGQDSKYVNGNIYIKYLDSVTTGDIELADENAIMPLENTTYISSNGSASIDYWSKEE